jgi:putative ABC transport system substrate-binding protein
MAEGGGPLSYGANNASLHQRVAFYLDRVLKGANPADMPVEQPGVFELVVNLKTAKVLGLRIPASVLTRADHVIE